MLTFVDLFCGGGFGARGAVSAGAIPLLGVDAWELATRTYQANFPDSDVITDRIENINPKKLRKKYKPDVLLTSPECTSHSIARGSRPACERSRNTAFGIIPWTEALQPRWLIVENVSRMKQWHRHDELVNSLESSGYHVSDLYLNAADFGTPQSRKRMFLVCDRFGTKVRGEDLIKLHSRSARTAASIIDQSDKYKALPLYKARRAEATIERAERAIQVLGEGEPFLVVYYGSDYAGGWQTLDAPLRTITTLDRFGLVTWKNGEPFLRMLQPDELSAAMGAGRNHKLPFGSRREKIRLCGNGVCSPVMEMIFRHIRKTEEKEAKLAS